jgi:hypothetical protein
MHICLGKKNPFREFGFGSGYSNGLVVRSYMVGNR